MPISSGRDQGAAQAYAEELLLHFGSDLYIEDDLDDSEEEAEDDYDSDLEDDLDVEFGLDDEDEDLDLDEGFGGSSSFPSRVLQAENARYGKGLLAGVGKTLSSAAGFSASAAQGLLASGYNPWAPPPPVIFQAPLSQSTPQPVPVVSDREMLPPVYVVDPVLATQAEKAPSISSHSELFPTTKFGASFQEGSIRPRRGQDREAIIRAKLEGAKELRGSSSSSPAPMVEDPTALPFLFLDGTIREPIYGALSLIPCPSCHGLSKSRYGATGNGCVVCDDYGAILTPTSDLPNVVSAERFGFVASLLGALAPLATQAAQLGGQAIGAKKQAVAADTSARAAKVYARLQQQLEARKAAAFPAKTEEAPSSEASVVEKVSGIGGFLGGLDDLEDLDLPEEEFGMDDDTDFGEDEDPDDDLDDDSDDDDDLDDDLDDEDEEESGSDDLSSEGRIVRILFPRDRS